MEESVMSDLEGKRVTGASPVANSIAAKEWGAYIEALAPLGERLVEKMLNSDDPQLRQEMYRMLFMGMSTAYMGLFIGDPEYPEFWPIYHHIYNWFAPNPDDTNTMAPVSGDGVYKISGDRGTVRLVDFQIGAGKFLPLGIGGFGPTLANYDIDSLNINKEDGKFEVILSPERPADYAGDWWKLDSTADYIMVRQRAYDWVNEVDGRFSIDRLDRPAIKPRQTEQELKETLGLISVWAENYSNFAIDYLKTFIDRGLLNKVVVDDLTSRGGLSTQRYINGLFDIKPDEALIYETEVPEQCRYWNIELLDMLFSVIDYVNRHTSLNGYTERLDKDGKFRAVISATDPGVPNWLDTAGYAKGAIFARWTECSSFPTPFVTKVKLADVRKYLPADTPVVSAEARDASLRLRRKGAQLRRRW